MSTSPTSRTPGLDDWRQAAERTLKGRPLDSVRWTTADGFRLDPVLPRAEPGPVLEPRTPRLCLSIDLDEPLDEARRLGFDVVRIHHTPGQEDGGGEDDEISARVGDGVLVDPGGLGHVDAALDIDGARIVVGETWASEDATPAQQIGWALSTLLDAAGEADDDVARLVVEVPVGVQVVTEIAKLRALRLLWGEVARERDVTGTLTLLASGPSFPMTGVDCESNLLRAALSGFAAVCGGADLVELAPYRADDDARLREACRLAANQMRLMLEESHLGRVGDPWAGSDVVEHLTARLIEAGRDELTRLRGLGGHLAADRDGNYDALDAMQEPYAAAETRRAEDIAHRRLTVVGLNRFADPSRDRDAVLADEPENAFEFADVEGLDIGLAPGGGVLDFEWLRERMLWHEDAGHARPTVTLLPLGPKGPRRARADFAADLFRAGGFAIDDPQGFDDVGEAIAHARGAGSAVAVVCGDDASYADVAPRIAAALPGARVFVAGPEPEGSDTWGVTGFVHRKTNALRLLAGLHDDLGIRRLP